MVKIPVPEEYAGNSTLSVAGRNDYHYGSADVNLDDRKHARSLTVREDADGWYVGTNDRVVVEAVAELFEVDVDLPEPEAEDESDEEVSEDEDAESGASGGTAEETTSGSESDGEDDTATESGTCEAVKNDGEVCGRDLPCPYHDDEEG